jgi:uncharacterized protein YeaO (DUF488 family)
MKRNIKLKRAYEPYNKQDGTRILIDRLWPRGIKKENAKIDFWFKEIAPTNELRKWYSHTPEKYQEFKKRYWAELDKKHLLCKQLLENGGENMTLVFSAKAVELSNAPVLLEYLKENF